MKIKELSKPLVFVNGKLISDETILAPFLDESEVNVFETIGIYDGKAFLLDEHLRRLFESAKTIGLTLPKSENDIRKEIGQVARHCEEADRPTRQSHERRLLRFARNDDAFFIRPTIFRGQMFTLVFKRVYKPEIYEKGADLKTSAVKRNLSEAFRPEAKTGQFLNGVLASLDPQAADSFEMLFLDRNGDVKETRISNIFIVRKGLIKTPESAGILDGVTRRFVIKCARQEGIEVIETRLSRHDIWNAEEAFLTNTSGTVLPIRSLDGRMIGEKVPGNVTEKLKKRFDIEFDRWMKETYGQN